MQLKEYLERREVSLSFTLYINLYEIFFSGLHYTDPDTG